MPTPEPLVSKLSDLFAEVAPEGLISAPKPEYVVSKMSSSFAAADNGSRQALGQGINHLLHPDVSPADIMSAFSSTFDPLWAMEENMQPASLMPASEAQHVVSKLSSAFQAADNHTQQLLPEGIDQVLHPAPPQSSG